MTPYRNSQISCGSVAPHALRWAIASGALAVVYHRIFDENEKLTSGVVLELGGMADYEKIGWSLFTMILGFLTALRAQLAYNRYWEGITLVERACGVWLNGCSNLIAFCSASPENQKEVQAFQYLLSRLMSLLVCYSMCDISQLDRECFPHLDLAHISLESLQHLEGTSARRNIVLQWVQRLVVEKSRSGIIDIAPPILSRVFQEFSIGYVHMIDANKITTVPFPFHLAQLTWVMLAFYCLLPLPMFCAIGLHEPKACGMAFLVSFVFWYLHYAALRTERPFGNALSDLPLEEVNHRFNSVLQRLLEPASQETPSLVPTASRIAPTPEMGRRFTSTTDNSDAVKKAASIPQMVSSALLGRWWPQSSISPAPMATRMASLDSYPRMYSDGSTDGKVYRRQGCQFMIGEGATETDCDLVEHGVASSTSVAWPPPESSSVAFGGSQSPTIFESEARRGAVEIGQPEGDDGIDI